MRKVSRRRLHLSSNDGFSIARERGGSEVLTSRGDLEGSVDVPAFSFLAALLGLPLASSGFIRASWALVWTGCSAELVWGSTGVDIAEMEHARWKIGVALVVDDRKERRVLGSISDRKVAVSIH